MKKIMLNFGRHSLFILFLIAGACALTSCPRKIITCGDPISYYLKLTLVDKNDSVLIGKRYIADSIRLTVNTVTIATHIEHGSLLFRYSGLDTYNSSNYYLHLSKDDTDTLNLRVYTYIAEECGTYWDFGGLKYNAADISPEPGDPYAFKIRKE